MEPRTPTWTAKQSRTWHRQQAGRSARLLRIALFGLLLAFAGLWFIEAQVTTADILGTVTDGTGAIVPGAGVTIISIATGDVRSAKSDSRGEYVITGLQSGHYRIEVRATGFKTQVIPDLLAAAGDRAQTRRATLSRWDH